MLNITELKRKIERLSGQINVPENLMPTFGSSREDGTAHIEIHGSNYYYIVSERGSKVVNRETSDLKRLLYWVFDDITFYMASSYERDNRDYQVDSRKLKFEYQLELLRRLKPLWSEWKEQEIAQILKICPYKNATEN